MGLISQNTATWKATVRSLATHLPSRSTLWEERVLLGFLLAILAPVLPQTSSAQAPSPTVKLSPETIQMGAFYSGAKVRIEGTAPAGSQVLVVIRGEEHDELFNKKGRVGPIWVNTDKIHVAFTPSLFLSFSSADVTALLDPTSIETYQLDQQAIKNRLACRTRCKCSPTTRHHTSAGVIAHCAGVEPDPQYRELIASNYLALKSREGRYQTHSGVVRIVNATGDNSRYSVDLDWPRSAPPGSYEVEVYACQNRSVAARTTTVLQVVEVGFPAQMVALAAGRPWVYGIVAVLGAVFAGFIIDAITSRLRRRSTYRPRPQDRGQGDSEPAAANHANAEEAAEREPAHRF